MKVFLTGATGYVGRAIAAELSRRGHHVVALVRDPARAGALRVPFAEFVVGDLSSPHTYAPSVASCDAAVHAAFDYGRPDDEARRLDAAAVRALAEALGRGGDGRRALVYTSNAYAMRSAGGPALDEGAATGDLRRLHGAFPFEVEDEALSLASPRLRSAVVRLGMVYGGSGGTLADVFAAAARGERMGGLGEGARASLVSREDAAALYATILEAPDAEGVYHAVDGRPLPFDEVVRLAAEAARGFEARDGSKGPAAALCHHTLDVGARDVAVVAPRSRALGWAPRYASFAEGARPAFEAFRTEAAGPSAPATGPQAEGERPDPAAPALAPLTARLLLALGLLALGPLASCARPDPTAPAPPTQTAPARDANAAARLVREGWGRYREGDYPAAVRGLERALAADPGNDQLLYLVALASLRAGDEGAAMRWLGRLADAGSDLVPTRDQFGELAKAPGFDALARRIAANAARHRRSAEAFRVAEKGLLPEGIAHDPAEGAFYIGSATRRKIVKITPGRAPVDFAGPRPDLDAIGGLRVDAARRRLWAVTGTDRRMDGFSAGEPERNALTEFDLATGQIVGHYPLREAGEHGLNDVAVDAAGRPYATDTSAGQIYGLDEGRRSLVPAFDAPPFFRPNGLTFDDKGKTLFVSDATGVHRVDLEARTTAPLARPAGVALAFFDGLYFVRSAGGPRLVGVQSIAGPGRVVSAALTPALDAVTGVETLESDHPLFDAPTTGAIVGKSIFVIANSQLWAPRPPREVIVLETPL